MVRNHPRWRWSRPWPAWARHQRRAGRDGRPGCRRGRPEPGYAVDARADVGRKADAAAAREQRPGAPRPRTRAVGEGPDFKACPPPAQDPQPAPRRRHRPHAAGCRPGRCAAAAVEGHRGPAVHDHAGLPGRGRDLVAEPGGGQKLFFHDQADGNDYQCSASIVARRVVLTAGHCVYDGTFKKWMTNWVCVLAYNGNLATQPFGMWSASMAGSTGPWMGGGGTVPNASDFGVLVMKDQFIAGQTRKIGE